MQSCSQLPLYAATTWMNRTTEHLHGLFTPDARIFTTFGALVPTMGAMALRKVAQRLRSDPAQLDRERLRDRFQHNGLTRIDEVPCRRLSAVGGEVKRMCIAPRSGIPSFEVVVSDGTGDAVAVFTGRRSIPGVEHGRGLVIEGVARDERGRRIFLNPAYTLLPQ